MVGGHMYDGHWFRYKRLEDRLLKDIWLEDICMMDTGFSIKDWKIDC